MNQIATPITDDIDDQTHTRLTIQPMLAPPDGSAWAYDGTGYTRIMDAWAVEQHIPPAKAHEKLGDVESWAAYVRRFGDDIEAVRDGDDGILVTWTTGGLKAVLDYHSNSGEPDRCQWIAEHPFSTTRQWQAWMSLANNRARTQRELIEALEEHRPDIKDPDAATLVGLIRTLRATINVAGESELSTNGNTKLTYSRQTTTSVELPPSITVGIPVLKGHTAPDANGVDGPVIYRLEVLVRVDVLDEDKGKLGFRLTIPNAEQILEDAVADRVAKARELLGGGYTLLRGAS